jgi:4-diphosphocytidyl-2-C-methyl-D-erythritol kinase
MQTWLAPAKLNLFLHVVGQRADGYHLLQSVFCLIDWCDEIRITTHAQGRIHRAEAQDWAEDDDLAIRAARALKAYGQRRGLLTETAGGEVSIRKAIPNGAGLGGGSSDAATTLIAFNSLWGLNLPRKSLAEIGLTLGADVPFFLHGQAALVGGVGESMESLQPAAQWFVVVVPPQVVPTALIFKDPTLTRNTAPMPPDDLQLACKDVRWTFGHNDLEPVACRQFPVVARWRDHLRSAAISLGLPPTAVRMSGSGGSCFVSCQHIDEARALAERLSAHGLERNQVRVCRALTRHPALHGLP